MFESRGSVIGTATSYGLDNREFGVRVPVGSRIFAFPHRPDRLWGPHNLVYNGYWGALSQEENRHGREADHSPQTSAEAKKTCICTSTPPYVFMAYCLIG
jgi:hypothetical protein